MDLNAFLTDFREAFGQRVEFPLVFWYSETPAGKHERVNGCFFKALPVARKGETVSLSAETIGCGGGKLYTGFSEVPPHVAKFVSLKEKYKEKPEDVMGYIQSLDLRPAEREFLNFARLDTVGCLDDKEGVIFFAAPDVLSGLTAWAFFDNHEPGAVTTLFGSGCSVTISLAVRENRNGGRAAFLGLFDPSVRPFVGENELSFTIPMSRLREMAQTIRRSCLFDAPAWKKVRERIDGK